MSRFKEENKNITVFRPWGSYTVIECGDGYLIKTIEVKPKQKLSVQSHNHRCEHWVVLNGIANVLLGEKEFTLKAGEHVDIKVKEIHSLQNKTDEPLKILEIQKGELLSEDDIIRYSDIYGRV